MKSWIVTDWWGHKWPLPPWSIPFSLVTAISYHEQSPYIVGKLRGTSEMTKCSTCRHWSASMRFEDELGERAFCLAPRSELAATYVPRSASCAEHYAGEPVDSHLAPKRTAEPPTLEAAE